MIPSMQVLCKGSAESCARRGSQVTRLRRVGRLWVDAVEKVGATLTTRNNRIAQAGFLNRSCAFDARLESILLEDPLKIFFRQYRPKADIRQIHDRLSVRSRPGTARPMETRRFSRVGCSTPAET